MATTSTKVTDIANAEVDAIADTVIQDVATRIWDFAEVSYKEFKSSAYASETLEKQGFVISNRGVGGLGTSWVATWNSSENAKDDSAADTKKNKPIAIGILVEFDALPDLGNDLQPTHTPAKNGKTSGHGCGHNLICSTSLGAGIALKNYLQKNNSTDGGEVVIIKLFGCPAEEALNGKNYMAASGAFGGLDVVLHNHPMDRNTVWNLHSAASIDLIVEWKGVTAHAGAAPWEGRSALHAAEIFLVAANMMREQMLPTARLHYQILNGGSAVNVVPDYAKVLIRYRGPSADNLLKHKQWLTDMAKGAALCTQTTETVTNLGGIYDCLPNDVLAERMTEHMHAFFPIAWTEEEQAYAKAIQKEMGKPEKGLADSIMPIPYGVETGGSSDVGDVSWQMPTMGIVYGSWPQGIPPHQWGCTACNGNTMGIKASVAAAKGMMATALDCVLDPAFLQSVKDNFVKTLNGREYVSLCDTSTNPSGELDMDELRHFDCAIHAAMEHFGIKDDHHDHHHRRLHD